MRWPDSWKDPSTLDLVKGSAIDCLLVNGGSEFERVRAQAGALGLRLAGPDAPPSGVTFVKGAWPGVNLSGGGATAGGPTGVPWVDSNGWAVRLSAALHPDSAVWVDAPPKDTFRVAAGAYLTAVADSAAFGGRWIIALDAQLASELAGRRPQALETWKTVTAAAGFFAARRDWDGYVPIANIGVVSSFTGADEFFSHELLNLLARAGGHYRVAPKGHLSPASFEGLRAVLYADAEPPAPEQREQILAFVQAGGLLITVPKWGAISSPVVKRESHPPFAVYALGKGRIAQAVADPDDPYMMASDAVVLLSHRHDLVRFWNGGATGSYYAMAPDRKRAVAHLLFYADRGPDSASVRIAGRYRSAKAAMVGVPSIPNVEAEFQKDAVELHLPRVSQYVALELEV